MADFFGGLMDSLTGKMELAPYQPLDLNAALMQGAAGALAGERAYAPGFMDLQLQMEQKYDPNIAALRAAQSRAVLNELNLGGSLSPEIQQLVTQNALQSGAASGFGLSQGGRGLVARDLGLTSLDLGRARRGEAGGYVRSAPSLNSLYSARFDPSQVAQAQLAQQQAQQQADADRFYNDKGNELAMYNKFGEIAGTVVGGVAGSYMGNTGAGMEIGRSAGGQIFSNPYRAKTSGGGGTSGTMDYTALLKSVFGNKGTGGTSTAPSQTYDWNQSVSQQPNYDLSSTNYWNWNNPNR